jgi:hypothetical protein
MSEVVKWGRGVEWWCGETVGCAGFARSDGEWFGEEVGSAGDCWGVMGSCVVWWKVVESGADNGLR